MPSRSSSKRGGVFSQFSKMDIALSVWVAVSVVGMFYMLSSPGASASPAGVIVEAPQPIYIRI